MVRLLSSNLLESLNKFDVNLEVPNFSVNQIIQVAETQCNIIKFNSLISLPLSMSMPSIIGIMASSQVKIRESIPLGMLTEKIV